MKKWAFALVTCALLSTAAPAQDEPAGGVVVTVKPLHSLVAAVMEGDTQQPVLLVSGKASPHTFQLTPSQVQQAEHAAVLFANGAGLEPFLPRLEQALPKETRVVVMARQIGMFLLPLRKEAMFEGGDEQAQPQGEAEETAPAEPAAADPHLWMDPVNAINMVDIIVENLSEAYPRQAGLYAGNGEALKAKIKALDDDIRERMAMLRGSRFIEFHDALQYFEHAYGLQAAGTVLYSPETPPGAQHLANIRQKVESREAVCILQEPEGNPKLLEQVNANSQARIGTMDPEGLQLDPGPALYLNLLSYTANEIEKCLM